jgi:hypothetical protein
VGRAGSGRQGEVDRGIATVLGLLDRLREATEDIEGIGAIAMARLWVVDGVRWFDAAARKIAEALVCPGFHGV